MASGELPALLAPTRSRLEACARSRNGGEQSLAEALRATLLAATLQDLGPALPDGLVLVKTLPSQTLLADRDLSDVERQALVLVDGAASVGRIVDALGADRVPRGNALRALLLLWAARFVTTQDEKIADADRHSGAIRRPSLPRRVARLFKDAPVMAPLAFAGVLALTSAPILWFLVLSDPTTAVTSKAGAAGLPCTALRTLGPTVFCSVAQPAWERLPRPERITRARATLAGVAGSLPRIVVDDGAGNVLISLQAGKP